jgi:hypothetical protein
MAAIEALEAPGRIGTDGADRTRLVLVAASLGTVFEWYDFFLYGTLAVFFGALFFPPGNEMKPRPFSPVSPRLERASQCARLARSCSAAWVTASVASAAS